MNRRGFTLVEVLVVLAIVGLLISLLIPAVQQLRAASQRTACANHLRNQVMAVHAHDAALERLPPSAIVGPFLPKGVPDGVNHGMWSTLLGFIGEDSINAAYRFSVSYDHEDNQPAVTTGIGVLRCPGSNGPRIEMWDEPPPLGSGKFGATGEYGSVAVSSILIDMGWVEPDTNCDPVFSVNSKTRLADIKDGKSTTILLVEAPGHLGAWGSVGSSMAPREFAHGDPPSSNGGGFASFSSPHAGGANVAFADGSTRFLKSGMSTRVLGALLTKSGSEPVGGNEF